MQNEMKARQHVRRERRPKVDWTQLRRRVAATMLIFERGWSAREVAQHFDWPVEYVEAWFEAGKPLR